MMGTQFGSSGGSSLGCRNEECCGEGQKYDTITKKCNAIGEGFVNYNNLSEYTSLGARQNPVIVTTADLPLPKTPVTPHIFQSNCATCTNY